MAERLPAKAGGDNRRASSPPGPVHAPTGARLTLPVIVLPTIVLTSERRPPTCMEPLGSL
jgi:hypothetical protein